MKVIKISTCYGCPYNEAEWNRKNQNYDMRCKKFYFDIISGNDEVIKNEPIPNKCGLEELL
jgi:hypothetical protein